MKLPVLIGASLLIILQIPLLYAQSIPEPDQFIQTIRLSDRVHIVRMGEVYPDQVVVVATEKGLVLIDSGISPTLSTKYRNIIQKKFPDQEFPYVINTHHHFDHTNGNQVFSDAAIVAHANCSKKMRQFVNRIPDFVKARRERYSRRWEVAQTLDLHSGLYKRLRDLIVMSHWMCQDLEHNFVPTYPTMTFNDRLTLDMDDLTIKLSHFPGSFHSDNDIVVLIPEEGIAFTGDLFHEFGVSQRVTTESELGIWILALDDLLKNGTNIKHVVTIHSGVLPGEILDEARETFIRMQTERDTKCSGTAILAQGIEENGIKQAVKQVRKLYADMTDLYYFWEGDLIDLGLRLLSEKKVDDAVRVFELNRTFFPASVDAHDWLGHGYSEAGMLKKAIQSFRRSLELNPLNSYAIDMIHQAKSLMNR